MTKSTQKYGLPYMGSKSTIAEWVISHLPKADTLVDAFAGGCALTHAAMRSRKFNRIIDSPKCNLNKKKNESIMKYINYGVKTFENRFHKNRKEKRNSLDSGKCKKTDNNDICFNEKELNENTLEINNGRYIENKQCGIMINRVLNFETGINGIFNQFKISKPNMNDNKMSFLNKNHSTKNMKEKKESCSTVISSGMNNYDKDINQEEDGDIKNIENIIKINLDYNINKKKNLRKK